MKISVGDVLLARFPFTDLTGDKRRPVLVLSAVNDGADMIVCAITSRPYDGPYDIPVEPSGGTLERSTIAGQLGAMPGDFMEEHQALFRSLFGFSRVTQE